MDEELNDFRLMEPVSPEALIPSSQLWLWVAIAAIIAGALAVIAWHHHRGKQSQARRANTFKMAHAEAALALSELASTSAKAAATEASLILRRYLAAVANDPALFETHEEFVSRHDSLQALSPDTRAQTEQAFNQLASLKYAPVEPQTDPNEVIAGADRLLQSLNREFTG